MVPRLQQKDLDETTCYPIFSLQERTSTTAGMPLLSIAPKEEKNQSKKVQLTPNENTLPHMG